MEPVAWIMVVVHTVAAVATGALIRPMWRAARRLPELRSGLVVWIVLVAVAASVPVVILVTGRTGWYPRAAGAVAIAIGGTYAWVQRKAVAAALRGDDVGGPPGRPRR